MRIATAHNTDSIACIADLQPRLASPKLVVYFASSQQDQLAVGRSFKEAFPEATVLGCSTAGEISSCRMADGSVTAMALPSDAVASVAAVFIEDLRNREKVQQALEAIASQLGSPLHELDLATHVGLVLVDGLSGAEEALMEALGDLTDLPFVGGSAGDDLVFKKTFVSLDGCTYDHGAVLAVLQVPNGHDILKAQSFRSTGKTLTATSVNEADREVLEFNGQSATQAYAALLGVPAKELPNHFMDHPVGLMMDGVPYVRSPQRVTDNGSIVFYCNIREGMELEVLESTDIVSDTGSLLDTSQREMGIAGLINFNCILRTLELKAKGQCDSYARLFANVPAIGFSTYGEQYLGHINQTATMLLFKQ